MIMNMYILLSEQVIMYVHFILEFSRNDMGVYIQAFFSQFTIKSMVNTENLPSLKHKWSMVFSQMAHAIP